MRTAHRVLIVDDDEALAEAIGMALGRRYGVHYARTGAEAIASICESSFDLILLEHRPPDLLGTDLLKLIKRFFPSTTVVFMTMHGSEDVAIEGLREGVRDFLRKPFMLEELDGRVDSLFAVRRNGLERRHKSIWVPSR